jgi:ketosteroid isomerase-like protein
MSTIDPVPLELPPPVAAYFAADAAGDADALAGCFAEDAVVIDERGAHRGRAAITRWRAAASAKYRYTSEPLASRTSGDAVTVTGRVTGDFPGSPIALHYRFEVAGDRIAGLEITP